MGRGRWAARHPTGAARHPPRGRRAHPAAVGHGPTGRQARLDDALGHTAWAVLSTAPAGGRADLERWRRASVQVLQLRHAGSDPGPGAVVDVQNQLRDWMRSQGVTAIAVRPDSIVYADAAAGEQLPAPPSATMPPAQRVPATAEVPAAYARVPGSPGLAGRAALRSRT